MRIVIVGTSCAGKSTFARAYSKLLNLSCFELDELYWSANWTPRSEAEFRDLAGRIAATEQWVVEGNYKIVRDILWPRATQVIWLNYGFATIFIRGLRRSLRRAIHREELWHGNRESLRRTFLSKDSILLWIIATFRRRRREFNDLRARGIYRQLEWIEFRNPETASAFLNSVTRQISERS